MVICVLTCLFVHCFNRTSVDEEVAFVDDTFSDDNTSDEEEDDDDSSFNSSKDDPEQLEESTVRFIDRLLHQESPHSIYPSLLLIVHLSIEAEALEQRALLHCVCFFVCNTEI